MTRTEHDDAETIRLREDGTRTRNWTRWGPYLSERQWGTVREDYSADGDSWSYFPHDHARSRVYRWGEDGLLGITDRECRLCFAVALWNERDPILKERLFGLTGPEGNHGEDVKEQYFYLDATPTGSYLKALYKYPQREFPYARLVEENRRRGKLDAEFELVDTGAFDESRYFDVFAEYAKAAPEDILIRLTIANRGPESAVLHVLPTLWYRNTWAWGRAGEGYWPRPRLHREGAATIVGEHASLGRHRLTLAGSPVLLFTDNETNEARLFGAPNPSPWVKDAFHEYVVTGRTDAVNPDGVGTKAAAHYRLEVPAGGSATIHLRLTADTEAGGPADGPEAEAVFTARIREADAFYDQHVPAALEPGERAVVRQGYAGLLWTKQFYHLIVKDWLEGDPAQPPPPTSRRSGRNAEWRHLFNRDVISMPDKWEYPWYAAWDLGFHLIPLARIDPEFAKSQLVLFMREWYMQPNGQIPAYEFAFSDVNPPTYAWAAWRIYKMTGARGARDRVFLSRMFLKLSLNFTWWVNRKDRLGNNLFGGGFLGMDNIGVFDRSQPLPGGAFLEQADGTAWMGMFCIVLLEMALELARGRSGVRGHGVEVLRALRRHRGFRELARRQRAVVPGGGLLLRPAPCRWARGAVAGAVAGGPPAASRLHGDGGPGACAVPGIREADAMVPRQPPRPGRPYLLRRARQRPAPAGAAVPGAARPDTPVHARRARVPLPVRHPIAVGCAPRAPLRAPARRPGAQGRVQHRGVDHRAVRRQLQLARTALAADELSADRGAGALPPLLRR